MRTSPVRLLFAATSLLGVLALLWMDLESASPGPISAPHAQVAELLDATGCQHCHGDFRESLVSACSECHDAIGGQLADGGGFHGTLQATDPADCGACHVEHHGDALELVSAASFERAGHDRRADYDHRGLEFGLAGAHAELDCSACHENADTALLLPGESRFLGVSADCQACHDDPHESRLGPACASCHGQQRPFAEAPLFAHPPELPLAGAHAAIACATCHPPGGERSVEAAGARRASGSAGTPPARACADCHASPHRAPFVAAFANAVGTPAAESCAACHPIQRPADRAAYAFSAAREPELARWHDGAGFSLTPPHAAVRCQACHASDRPFEERYPGRVAGDCAACHADPHGGQFADGPLGPSCLDCHARRHFTPAAFGLEQHAETAFPLEGGHGAVGCYGCHVASAGGPEPGESTAAGSGRPGSGQPGSGSSESGSSGSGRSGSGRSGSSPARSTSTGSSARGGGAVADRPVVFRGTTRACGDCHRDAHGGTFAATAGPVGCATCHDTTTFDRAREFDHARWTGFRLEGAHAAGDCESCHPRSPEPDAAGRRFGRVRRVFGAPPRACATCHEDVHAGAFAVANVPERVADRAGCARCHNARAFAPVADFDHALWTDFALDGAHARAACESCHTRSAEPDASGRTLGRARDRFRGPLESCATCHADPHGGAFDGPAVPDRVAGRTGCARCHDTESFQSLTRSFEHARFTGFALVGSHAEASCAACHPRTAAETPGAAIADRAFGPAAGAGCADCHGDPHAGQFSDAGPADCARCHPPAAPSFTATRFDHATDARFALDERHARLECAACHLPWPIAGGGQAVRYRPLGVECGDCHKVQGGPRATGRPGEGRR